jgi:hypothetical protein
MNLYSKFLLLLVAFIFYNNALSQDNNDAYLKYKFGLVAGLNYPDIRFEDDNNYNNFKINFLLGFSFEFYLSKDFSLKTNINYERRHRRNEILQLFNQNVVGSEFNDDFFHFINVPVLMKYEFANDTLFFNTGPFANYLLGLDRELVREMSDTFEFVEQKDFDFGLSLGFGGQIPIGNNQLVLELRNDLGLIDVGGYYTSQSSFAKTNTVKLLLGWNF